MEQRLQLTYMSLLWNHSNQASIITSVFGNHINLTFPLIFAFDNNSEPLTLVSNESYTELCEFVIRLFNLSYTPVLRVDWARNTGIGAAVWLGDRNIGAMLHLL